MTSEITKTGGVVERAGYMIENPSAWDAFDQNASDLLVELAAAIAERDERIERLEKANATRAERLKKALRALLACSAIADEDHTDPTWGDLEMAEAVAIARAALQQEGE